MSAEINMHFKKGSIRKVIVRNFVTYAYAEMLPGPNLNMLIGPNGTGKSTIVAAIILGLGGNPKTIGRGHKVSEYVKYNCENATVTIYLEADDSEQISITRQFDLREKSLWKLNDKEITFKEIDKIIKKFNIQVDNLCQFLPQDKVADFAKMNKQQLLQQMQVAVCRNDLIEKQQNLIKKRERHKQLNISLEKHKQKLQELHDANVRLEGKIQSLNKRKKYLQQIEHLDRKIAWLQYELLTQKMDEVEADKNKTAEILQQHRTKSKPIENALRKAKSVINNLQEKVMTSFSQVNEAEKITSNKIEQFDVLRANINRAIEEKNNSLQQVRQQEDEIKTTSEQIAHWNRTREELHNEINSEEGIFAKIHSLNQNIRKISTQMSSLVDKKNQIEDLKTQALHEKRLHENDLERLENVKEQRMRWLCRIDKDAYKTVNWLRSNKHLFNGEVFEPMMLELNVKNQSHAIFVENSIPMRDKLAFTCTVKEDMNVLIRTIRDQKNWNINVVHSGNEGASLDSYKPRIPLDHLEGLGFFAYVKDLITGPEPILKYLCKNYQIHNIPVGNHHTNSIFEHVPKQITNFFSDTYHFSTTFSKYTGAKSVRQTQIRSDGSLSNSVDTERIEAIRQHYNRCKTVCEKHNNEQQGIEKQISILNEEKSSTQEEIKSLQDSIKKIKNIESRLRILNNKLNQLHATPVNVEEIEKRAQMKIKEIISKMLAHQQEIVKYFKKYSSLSVTAELMRLNLDSSRKQVAILDNKLRDIRKLIEDAEEKLRLIKETHSRIVSSVKVALRKAKDLSNGCTPIDAGFDEFREMYEKLSEDIEELEASKETILSKMDYLNTATDGELEEYEERQRNIRTTEETLKSEKAEYDELTVEMNSLQEKWLSPLRSLVEQINEKFSTAFRRMGCEGEVDMHIGNNENDYEEYGLSIKVKFRHSELLQELNNVVQSGGERAVATAIFMLSLQEITPVPFRCVDEINQGMDANNERRIFELLVETTSKEDTSQYFLITPKLVPGLKFVPTMKIHIVHNGCFVLSQKKWNSCRKI